MKRFTRNRHFMPGSPLWIQEQARLEEEAKAAAAPAKKAKPKSKKKGLFGKKK